MMTPDEQKELLSNFMDQVKEQLLSRAAHWPEHWDGIELRWLAREAIGFATGSKPLQPDRRSTRYRCFMSNWRTRPLY